VEAVVSQEQGAEPFATLLEESLRGRSIEEGQRVQGTIVELAKDHAIVDIGYKVEGLVALEELRGADGRIAVQPGDEVEVIVESLEPLDEEQGLCRLSKRAADHARRWDELAAAHEVGEPVEGVISGRIKGGLSVHLGEGLTAFLPASQADLRPGADIGALIGRRERFLIVKLGRHENIVVSRRAVLERDRSEERTRVFGRLRVGDIVEGRVKGLTDYGAFIDLGGVDGLLHVSDMSWGRVGRPADLFRVGDLVRVKVLKVESEAGRVSLGLKQITEEPWRDVLDRYAPGTVVRGRISALKDYGAFVDLGGGIHGLIHIGDLSWTQRVDHPSALLKEGEIVEAVVLRVEQPEGRRPKIWLGIKQLTPGPGERTPPRPPARGQALPGRA
jgi:small subunit ribosomal protein S1